MIIARVYGQLPHSSAKPQGPLALSSAKTELEEFQRGATCGCCIQELWLALYGTSLGIVVATDSSAGRAVGSHIGVGRMRRLDVTQL